MDRIPTKAEMIARWPRPRVTVLQPKAQAYQQLVDKLGEYEDLCSNRTLTAENQVSVLTDIYTASRQWVVANKGPEGEQGECIEGIRNCADRVIQRAQEERDSRNLLESFCHKAAKWYAHPWAWNLCYDIVAPKFAQEPYQLYEAIQRWQDEPLHGSRQGAQYIMSKFVTLVDERLAAVIVELSDVDPATILGKPIAAANISYPILAEITGTTGSGEVEDEDYEPPVTGTIRRADPGMFYKVIGYLEHNPQSTMFLEPRRDPFIKLIDNHIFADVIGPFPTADRTYHCNFA